MRILLLVAIPIVSLIGVYVFAATVTASNALNLSRSRSVYNTISLPSGLLESALDTERIDAVLYLADPAAPNLASLQAQEHKTDGSVAAFRAADARAAGSESAAETQAFATVLAEVTRLPALRSQVAARSVSRPQVIGAYGDMINQDGILETQIILQGADAHIIGVSLAINRTGNVADLLLQEEGLLLGDSLARSYSAADRQQFAELVGARRAMYAELLSDMDPAVRGIYSKYLSPQVQGPLEAMENRVLSAPRAGHVPPVSPITWSAAVLGVSHGYAAASQHAASLVTARAQPVANSIFLRLYLVGGLGLLGVILSIYMSVWIGRGLVRQLSELRRAAVELATKRLPGVVARLRAGQDVDVVAEAPPLAASSDEIGQVTQAFNDVQRTAVESAVDEAKLRRGVSDVFRNLARRSQSLLHRQLALLDTMERRATEPAELADLYRIDHLTTRMRRHSEGLIILSGETPGRGWRHPVRIVDVLRAAVAEVEDYTRIRVTTGTQAALIGPAVADVIHLIAELAENATIFSPPNTPVRIHGDIVGRGFAIEIEDRGLGIAAEKLAQINHDLEHPPPFDLSGSEQLGLFVAGRLARRHDIRITLQPSPYGGITAIVLIPATLIVHDVDDAAVAASERAIRLTGRHGPPSQRVLAEPVPLAQIDAAASTAGEQNGPVPDALAAGQDGAPPVPPVPPVPAAPAAPADEPQNSDPAGRPAASVAQAGSIFTPRRPRATAMPALPARPAAPATSPGSTSPDADADDPRVTTTELTKMGLPVRVRQASLAPQLRDGAALGAEPDEEPGGARSPEAARSTMTALQRGWERGRYIAGAPVPSFDVAPGSQPGGEDDEPRRDE